MSTSSLKVLHLITGLGTGGAEKMLCSLVEKTGGQADQHVVSLIEGGSSAEWLQQRNVPVAHLGMKKGIPDPRAVWRLRNLLYQYRPDVVQSWMYHADLMATLTRGLMPSYRPRLAWGIRCSDMDLSRYGRGLRLVVSVNARLSNTPDTIIVNSKAGKKAHIKLGFSEKKMQVIPNGIDTQRFLPNAAIRQKMRTKLEISEKTPVLIHVARVDPMKDHSTLLAAAQDFPGIVLLIGAGTENLGNSTSIRGLGRRDDIPDLMAAADILVSSSAFGEGFPNVVAEAMACGIPAVVTDVGDSAYIVKDTGVVVSPNSPQELSAALNFLIAEDRESLQKRGRAARLRIESEFSLNRAGQSFLHMWQGLA